MESYTNLLQRTRVPQPSLQKYAVVSIFSLLRSSPPHLGPESGPGSDAIAQCLSSTSGPVVDQSVREICRLVTDSKLGLSRGLLHLQSALEASNSEFVSVFVKGLGVLVRFGFRNRNGLFGFQSSQNHPFVKILSCRMEVQSELVQQVLALFTQTNHVRMEEICEFVRPFLNYAIIQVTISVSFLAFVQKLILAMSSLCCSLPGKSIPVIKFLMSSLKFFPCKNSEDVAYVLHWVECLMDAYLIVLTNLVNSRLPVHEAQLYVVELLEAIFSLHRDLYIYGNGVDNILKIAKHSLVVQKNLGLSYLPEFSSIKKSLFVMLMKSQLEHEQYSIAKFLTFLLKWKNEHESSFVGEASTLNDELLFILPIFSLQSSPSMSVKRAATELLFVLGKVSMELLNRQLKQPVAENEFGSSSSPESIIFRCVKHLWFQDQALESCHSYLHLVSIGDSPCQHNICKPWMSLLTEYSMWLVGKRKSSVPITESQDIFLTEMPLMLGSISCAVLMNPTLSSSAIDLLVACGAMDPSLSVSLLLTILFFNHIFSGGHKDINVHSTLLKLLHMLPSLASHSPMVPLVVQTILPMLQKDTNPALIATATRLICKVWEVNDRAFGSLQAVLLAKDPNQFSSDSCICISKAVSVRDVCRKDPDRGVDLILAIEWCIEHKDPLIQSLGVQSLAHLCEADVIDFYTAWDVIVEHLLNYQSSGIFAYGLCLLLRHGAGDAEAYPEAAVNVVKILWEIGTSRHNKLNSWTKARASAFEALTNYEVIHIQRAIPNFNHQHTEFFTSETEPPVLKALERFEVKILDYEHSTRRRLVKQKRVPGNKIEKLLDVFPKVLFASAKSGAREQPGAALFYLSFTSNDVNNQGQTRELHDIQSNYEASLLEIAASLRLSRNILVALLSLQSWKPFMRRWLKARISFLESKTGSSTSDKTSKAANDILKSIRGMAEDSIPVSAENIALAVGAFCLVLPPSAHAITSTASKFLLTWLFEYEHEYRQWSAAISLGLISSCLHLTDHKQKYENITALLDVMSVSRSTLVKGACAVGLGFSCQQLLTRAETGQPSFLNKETQKFQEADLLRKIIITLSHVISQYIPSLANSLRTLCAFFPSTDESCSALTLDLRPEENNSLEEDMWGVSGLVLGLGSSISAIYRGGGIEPVLHVKGLILSCIPHVNPSFKSPSDIDTHQIGLSAGSCLALPMVVSFCQKMELIQDNNEVNNVMKGSVEFISDLLSGKISKASYQSLMMAATVGAGGLLSSILNGGMHPLRNQLVSDLLVLFKRTYASSQPPLIHLGGMLGVVNALGAGAGMLVEYYPPSSLQSPSNTKESSYVTGPLLSMPHFENDVTSLVQEIFLVAQNSEDKQLQQYAAWAVSFLKHYIWSMNHQNDQNHNSKNPVRSMLGSQNPADDSAVVKLCYWLMHLYSEKDAALSMETAASVLRCLSHAPRLPPLEWEAIIRRCMRYEGQVAEISEGDLASKREFLREECIAFALSHASKHDDLLNFFDELLEVSRFRTLELNLQLHILLHLADLTKIFSDSRVEKLFYDVVSFLSSSASSKFRSPYQNGSLRIACWKGLHLCLDEFSVETRTYLSNLEDCMKLLFSLLPEFHWAKKTSGNSDKNTMEEWTEAVRCLGKARQGWLLNFLQTSETNLTTDDVDLSDTVKKIRVKARLVHMGSLPFSDLANLRAYVFNIPSEVSWDVMVDMVAALQYAGGSIKRQWLLDVLQISCVTKYPSTALQFVALLCGSCCKYMPVLVVKKSTVLSDLPVTLPSLLQNPSWMAIAESVVSYLWTSTERIYHWTTGKVHPDEQAIDAKESNMLDFLLHVMHRTCVTLNDYLPPDKKLSLANIVLS